MNLTIAEKMIEKGFAIKMRILRQLYFLTLKEEAELLGLKSGGNITAIESGKGKPSYETLLKIQRLYGISIDWLIGLSDIPYNTNTVLIALLHIQKKVDKMVKNGSIYPDFIVTMEDFDNSFGNLTVENQFNLILLQNYIIWDQKIGYANRKKIKTLNNKTLLTLGKHGEYYENMDKILTNNPQNPIYDLMYALWTNKELPR